MKDRISAHHSIVVPARNEGAAITETIMALRREAVRLDLSIELIVVDDGSTDQTARLAADAGARVITQPWRGKGQALRTGIAQAQHPVIVWCDADSPIPARNVLEVAVLAGQLSDVVVGFREISGHRQRVSIRAAIGALARHAWPLIAGDTISDPFCPVKAAPTLLAKEIATKCQSTGYAFDAEFLLRAQNSGAPLSQVKVPWSDTRGTLRANEVLIAVRELLGATRMIQRRSTPNYRN